MLAMAFSLAASAFAGEQIKMKVAVVEDDGHGEIRIELDSDDIGFNLEELQEGESRSIVDKSGQSIVVTRRADGFSFDVDGKTIDMPMLHGNHGDMVWVDEDGGADIDVHVMRNATFIGEDHMGSTMIMSAEPIDEATQQIIKSALESTGHDSEVHFVTHGAHHDAGQDGEHHVKVIKKVIEIKE
jgi:hypothetical protein